MGRAMRLAQILGPDLKATLANDPEELREALEEFHPEDIAELLEDLDEEERIALMRALPDAFAAEVLERLPEDAQTTVIERLDTDEAATLLTSMAPDDRVDVIQELEPEVAEKILAHMDQTEPQAAEEVRELGAYGERTAGGLMTTEYASMPPETKVWQAIENLRQLAHEGRAETVYSVYVVAYDKLVGVVSLRDLILGDPGQSLADVMTENVVRVLPTADQEEVARLIAKYDLSTIPVVDEQGKMLGVVTVDDVVDVVIEEATEDAQKMGAVQPIADPYFDTAFGTFIRKRATWLIVLFLGELLTATVMATYEDELRTMLTLVIFIPLIISSGGNAGSQSSSLIIRALAVGEVLPRDWSRVLAREAGIGIALGLVLGVVGFGRALIGTGAVDVAHQIAIACVVSVSVVAVVALGAVVGSLLPLGIKRIGLDPAVSSTPFIASLVDVVGLVVYFSVARLIMSLV